MRLSDSLRSLDRARTAAAAFASAAPQGRLAPLEGVTDNPGNLRALCYVPGGLEPGAPLVVVLHGCTQTADSYDHGSGWSRLADRHGFALLFPEQQRANNPNLCFNWFTANDSQRGMGEPASIRAMVDAMHRQHGTDRTRTFITGLSAGGAMASVMLATYPELFAAGAIIAGIAYGCASGVGEAFDCMGGRAHAEPAELVASVRRASPHKGPWPRVSVWQGSADHTVVPSNADAIVRQWTELHGLAAAPSRTETVEGYPRRVWADADGTVLADHYSITGMAHGTPVMPGTEEGQSGAAMAHMLDARISSTDRIASFFGIESAAPRKRKKPADAGVPPAEAKTLKPEPVTREPAIAAPVSQVQTVIEDALRAAGLMR